jgi:hypothetical protein
MERAADDSDLVPARNDAFSFWKLPEQWREPLKQATEGSAAIAERFLFERYLAENERRPSAALGAYYRVKQFIPIPIRHRINSFAIKARGPLDFPNWPCETALTEFWREWLMQALKVVGCEDGWHIGFWPNRARCAIVLTHDVESRVGFDRIERIADIEEKYDFRSAWNLPLAQYPIDWARLEQIRARGFELGAHGLCHDGRLFRSEGDFAELEPILSQLAQEHSLRGFRAPSTLRRAEWIATMPFDFDSSFSDTDPYEPQPGGTCSLFPFHLGRLIELPYTLPQDHTLIHLLRRDPLQMWTLKADWIASLGGMILTLTHPDYTGIGHHLTQYEELLKRFRDIENAWISTPSRVAEWWRRRSDMRLFFEKGEPEIQGDDTSGAAAVKLSEEPLVG